MYWTTSTYRQLFSMNSKLKVLMGNSWSCQTASQKNNQRLIQLNDADPKSKSFPFDTKPCRYPHTIFHSQNKSQKNDWKLCQPLLHHQRVNLIDYLKNVFIVAHSEWDRELNVTKWTFGLEQNHLYHESKVKEYFLCNTNVPVSVRSFFVFVKIISDRSRLKTFKASLKLPLLD